MIKRVRITSITPAEPKSFTRIFKELSALAISVLIHFVTLVLLGLFVFSDANPLANLISISGEIDGVDESIDLVTLDLTSESRQEALQAEPEFSAANLESQMEVQVDFRELPEQAFPDKRVDSEIIRRAADLSDAMEIETPEKSAHRSRSITKLMTTASTKGKSYNGPLLQDPKDGVRQTRSTTDAANGILDKLREATNHDGSRWILWVMDSSISLVNERQQLAPLVKQFYEDLKFEKKPGAFPWPTTAVFAFGQGLTPLGVNKGMPKPLEIATTLANVPVDVSGVENVMSAVATAVESVPFKNRKTRIEVVVWTDESGDDVNLLEDLILLCQKKNTRVHVVGPLAVLGMRKGLQQFTLPVPYNQPILLPFDRGPDSAFPERAELPYWYESTDIDWGNGPIIPADLGKNNFGGPHRQRLLAPSGPYGLTRLALATGGTFTAINRPGDIATTTREQLFDYMPDYRSALEIANDIDQYPLRKAVIQAAALTGTANYWPPRMGFPSYQSNVFPYRSTGMYQTPQRFAQQLPNDLGESVKRLRRAQVIIEQAIQIMMLRFQDVAEAGTESNSEKSDLTLHKVSLDQVTPSEYHLEQSPRWKAWYDLNLGRLLAHSVRIHEYMLQCEILASPQTRTMMLNRGYNQLQMTASQKIKGGPVSTTRVETAVQLLERVVREHADTPWGDLATWELEHPVGVKPVLSVRPPPRRIAAPVRQQPLPRPTIPRL